MRIQTIGHQVKFPVWRNKRYVAFAFEFVQTDTLVEFNVFHLDQFASCRTVLHIEEDFVIQP